MSATYSNTPDGYFYRLTAELGCIQATIHRPNKTNKLKQWRLCFATCTGKASPLQGKVNDFKTKEEIISNLAQFHLLLDKKGDDLSNLKKLIDSSLAAFFKPTNETLDQTQDTDKKKAKFPSL